MLDDEGITTLGDLSEKVKTKLRRRGDDGDGGESGVSTEGGGGTEGGDCGGGSGGSEEGGEGDGGDGGDGCESSGGSLGIQVREYLESLGLSRTHSEDIAKEVVRNEAYGARVNRVESGAMSVMDTADGCGLDSADNFVIDTLDGKAGVGGEGKVHWGVGSERVRPLDFFALIFSTSTRASFPCKPQVMTMK